MSPTHPPACRPTASCLVNNHNYGRFVCEAVSSALAQTVPFDEIIVVDDGSTDDSIERLQAAFGGEPKVRIIAKPNGGQLSAFNRGFEESAGELLFFLDADDWYEPVMLEKILHAYRAHPDVGLVFGPLAWEDKEAGFGYVRSGAAGPYVALPPAPDGLPPQYRKEILFGGGHWDAVKNCDWVGSPTSALSLRRATLARFMPIACEKEWRIRADDCLLFGAAAADVPRLYQPEPLVHYRVHGTNAFRGSAPLAPAGEAQRQAGLTALALAVLGRLRGRTLEAAELERMITDRILLEHRNALPFTKSFRQGWRAFRRAKLPKSAVKRGRRRLLAGALRRLASVGT